MINGTKLRQGDFTVLLAMLLVFVDRNLPAAFKVYRADLSV